jgi:GT2 family glycosyltransferase
VITSRDRATLLGVTLKSIRAQAFKDYEIIVVDDGTDAETPALCREYSTEYIHVGRAGVYRNPAQPINIGLRRAAGDIVILQNAECKHVDPNTIERLISLVSDRNVVFANVMGLKQDGSNDWLYCGLKAQRPFFFCGAMKRARFEALRGMDEDYPCGGYDDNDFADRLKHVGVEFVYSDISVHHQWHPRPALNAEAAARVYAAKTTAMAQGNITAVRNLGREWGALEPLTIATVGLPKERPYRNGYNYQADGMTCDWHDRHRIRRNS